MTDASNGETYQSPTTTQVVVETLVWSWREDGLRGKFLILMMALCVISQFAFLAILGWLIVELVA